MVPRKDFWGSMGKWTQLQRVEMITDRLTLVYQSCEALTARNQAILA